MTASDIAIISIFGRGHWLAVALAKTGIPVTLVDVTPDQGPWEEVDWEGPFGVLKSEIALEQNLKVQNQGVILWLNDGPVELQSPNAGYRLQKLGISKDTIEYIKNGSGFKDVQKLPFVENWLAQLSHTWNSTVSNISSQSLSQGKRANLFSDFSYYEKGSSTGLERSLKWLETNHVTVIRAKNLKDIATDKKGILSGIEIQAEKPGLLKAEQFVWTLSSAETRKLNEKIRDHLFPQGVTYPEWAWIRFRVEMTGTASTYTQLPGHSLILSDLHLPWSHENFVVLAKTGTETQFDAWMKIPHTQRFQKNYLQEMAKRVQILLQHKISGQEVKITDWPLEFKLDEQRLGPSPHPIYQMSDHNPKHREWGNVKFDGPEYWLNSTFEGEVDCEKAIYSSLKVWWDKKMEQLAKRTKERNS